MRRPRARYDLLVMSTNPTRTKMWMAAVMCAALCGVTNAQPARKAPEPLRPPTASNIDPPNVIVPYLLLVVLGAMVFGASAIPSKRGHQD